MLKFFFKPPEKMSPALRDELHSLCHSSQIQALSMAHHKPRDTGSDCGCDQLERVEIRPPH